MRLSWLKRENWESSTSVTDILVGKKSSPGLASLGLLVRRNSSCLVFLAWSICKSLIERRDPIHSGLGREVVLLGGSMSQAALVEPVDESQKGFAIIVLGEFAAGDTLGVIRWTAIAAG